MVTITYERRSDKERATCILYEEPVSGMVMIELQLSSPAPGFFQASHTSAAIAEAHLDKVFPISAGWTKAVATKESSPHGPRKS
jgi:hypothetical protein